MRDTTTNLMCPSFLVFISAEVGGRGCCIFAYACFGEGEFEDESGRGGV